VVFTGRVKPTERYILALFRVSADLHRGAREHNNLAPSTPTVGLWEEFKMGFLDEVIGAALGSKAQPAQYQPAQNQPAQTPPVQDPLAQIAAALTALLAPRPGAAPTGAAPTGAPGQQGSLGGLDVLINQFKQSGLEDVVNSWIGAGKNQPISPTQLRQVLGNESVNNLSRQTGAPQEDLLSQLSKFLPGVIDRLTPNGQVPSDAELRSGTRAN
jgi:uncharacterized protein YidB (DUF937 family)